MDVFGERNLADHAPGLAAVGGLGGHDLADPGAEVLVVGVAALAHVEETSVLQLDGPVRRRAGRANGRFPRLAAVGGAARERAQLFLHVFRAQLLVVQPPVELRRAGFQLGAVANLPPIGDGGEPRHHERAVVQRDDAGVAVVEDGVADVDGRAPRLAAVRAADQLRLAERADVLVAVAGEDGYQFAVLCAADGRPADVASRLLAYSLRPDDLGARLHARRAADFVRTQHNAGGYGQDRNQQVLHQ